MTKSLFLIALLCTAAIESSVPRLFCKTEVPTPPHNSPKSDTKGDSKAPATPRPTK